MLYFLTGIFILGTILTGFILWVMLLFQGTRRTWWSLPVCLVWPLLLLVILVGVMLYGILKKILSLFI
jgi:hypothetical protein